jgi:cytochrome c1
MSNRPNRKQPRSLSVQATANAKARRKQRSLRVRWVAVAVVGVVVVALAIGAMVRHDTTSKEPVLDAQATTGQQVAKDKGCVSCHTSDGSRSEGPTWKAMYGHTVTLSDGTTVQADEAYLTSAIRQPNAQIVSGFQPGMPTTTLTDDELAALIAYIKALG